MIQQCLECGETYGQHTSWCPKKGEQVSDSSPVAGYAPALTAKDALRNFEDALDRLQNVLFRDGIGVKLNEALCSLENDIARFKESNTLLSRQ